ncbi:MAG: hypothetical protein M3T96_06835 [Acidobacteriota bacterium]|nr:hypothetical protein [Acidobacteriota bacterium]
MKKLAGLAGFVILLLSFGADTECGFGHNVSANGTYKKTGGAKPKFENNQK